ncbi:MAG TPA: hydroxylamine reductase [Methanotrichaceae archaeon]|nr:hydroxylamine reductase [Methanotrichaceae archaeon]HQJ28757.1 hydroxylamine reductase [Methanotrichaceae archaeon]
MFCFQCQETAGGQGCTKAGVCGKDASTAELQDLLVYLLKGLSIRNLSAAKAGKGRDDVGIFVAERLFETLTNVNFDPAYFQDIIYKTLLLRDSLPPAGTDETDACTWKPAAAEDLASKAATVGVLSTENEDVRSLQQILICGLKGLGAYYHHAAVLGKRDAEIETFIQEALASTLQDLSAQDMTAWVLRCGSTGVKALALLDQANTEAYGKPEITSVSTKAGDRPGILISGHDLKDLAMLLEQTKGSGVDVYTHGEMLPAHAYPYFKRYDNLVGNYGGSWPLQREEFEQFNGPILMTTNCLVPPRESYATRVYTTGPVGFPGLKHIPTGPDGNKDFNPVIEQARLSAPPKNLEDGTVITGCAHDAVLALADEVIGAIKGGAIRRFVVMAGCDGRHKSRDYYARFAQALPSDTVILTAGCAKYRYNRLPLGEIGGIPRLLDAGQCNDCYSLVAVAQALAGALGMGINELPISYNIAWFEQKAVLVLLALLSLGVKDITLGPSLPAFVSPGVLKVLVESFDIKPQTTVEADLKRMVPA